MAIKTKILPLIKTPLLVALDTQVFYNYQFNYNTTKLMTLVSFVQKEKVKLLMTCVTHREIKRHLNDKAESIFKLVKKTAQSTYLNSFDTDRNKLRINSNLLNEFKDEVQKIVYNFDQMNEQVQKVIPSLDAIKRELQIQFEYFCEEADFETIKIDGVLISDVFENYFSSNPPFSEKKKDEFPDAFALFALKKEAEDKKKEIYLVSDDNDWKDFCSLTKNLLYYKNLDTLLELLNKVNSPDDFDECYELYHEREEEIKKEIENLFPNLNFTIEIIDHTIEWGSEKIQVNPESVVVDILNSTLIHIDDSNVNQILAIFDLEIDVDYVTLTKYTSIYEKYIKEDNDYYTYPEEIESENPQSYNTHVEITLRLSRDGDRNLCDSFIKDDINFNPNNTLDEIVIDLDSSFEDEY